MKSAVRSPCVGRLMSRFLYKLFAEFDIRGGRNLWNHFVLVFNYLFIIDFKFPVIDDAEK